MEQWTGEFCGRVLELWRVTTPAQFVQMALATVILGWFLTRTTTSQCR